MFDSVPDTAVVRDDSPVVRPPLLRPRARPRRTLGELIDTFGGQLIDAGGSGTDATALALTGISASSLDVGPGEVFVGLPGAHGHGARFAAQAVARGAASLVTDAAGARRAAGAALPTVVIDAPPEQLASMSAWMFATSARTPALFGVTGTNGKTSTTYMLHAVLTALGMRAGLSTTVERRIGTTAVGSRLTTPEAPELHTLLAGMQEEGAEAVALEVSAHAVSRGRIDGLSFDVVGFTNLGHDHLDEYGDMGRYLDAKIALFDPAHARRAVVSLDSEYGAEVARRSGIPTSTISSRPEVAADWTVRILDETVTSTGFSLTAPDGTVLRSRVSLMGRHMAENACLAIAMLVASGIEFSAIADALGATGLQVRVPGRSERVSGRRGPLVLVDFSHNGSAFASTLRALRRVVAGSLIVVVGADGDRDPSKRENMGLLAATHADVVVVTDHHPRHEDPGAIRAALLRGAARAGNPAAMHEVAQPADAIRTAVSLAAPEDAILWAGPGLTDYRVVGADRVPYSPRTDARAALREAGWS